MKKYEELLTKTHAYMSPDDKKDIQKTLLDDVEYIRYGDVRISRFFHAPLPERHWQHIDDYIDLLDITVDYVEKHNLHHSYLSDFFSNSRNIYALIPDAIWEKHLHLMHGVESKNYYHARFKEIFKRINHPYFFHPKMLDFYGTDRSIDSDMYYFYIKVAAQQSQDVHARMFPLVIDYLSNIDVSVLYIHMYVGYLEMFVDNKISIFDDNFIVSVLSHLLTLIHLDEDTLVIPDIYKETFSGLLTNYIRLADRIQQESESLTLAYKMHKIIMPDEEFLTFYRQYEPDMVIHEAPLCW